MRSWLKNLSVVGGLGVVSSVVGIATADYTFPTPRAHARIMLVPTENSLNRFVSNYKTTEEYEKLKEACRENLSLCSTDALIDRLFGSLRRFPIEYTELVVEVENISDLEVRNVHLVFGGFSESGDQIWSDYLEAGSAVRVGDTLKGSIPAQPVMYDIHRMEVCLSYRGRFHIDVIREKYPLYPKDHRDATVPTVSFIGFSERGEVKREVRFLDEDWHCSRGSV